MRESAPKGSGRLNRIDWTGTQPPKATEKGIWGWMLFDWAAQPFFTVVTTFIFGPYLDSGTGWGTGPTTVGRYNRQGSLVVNGHGNGHESAVGPRDGSAHGS